MQFYSRNSVIPCCPEQLRVCRVWVRGKFCGRHYQAQRNFSKVAESQKILVVIASWEQEFNEIL